MHIAYTDRGNGGRPTVRISMPGSRPSVVLHPHPDDWSPGVRSTRPWDTLDADKVLDRHGWERPHDWSSSDTPMATVIPVSDEARALSRGPATLDLGDELPLRARIGIAVAAVWVVTLILTTAGALFGRGHLAAWLVVLGVVFLAAAVVLLIPPPHTRWSGVAAFALGLPMLTAALVLAATAPPPTLDATRCAVYDDIADDAGWSNGLGGLFTDGYLPDDAAAVAQDWIRDSAADAGCP